MEVSLLFKIGAVGILVSVLCQILKHSQREELAFLTSLAGLVLVLFWILPYIYDLFRTIQELFALYQSGRRHFDFFLYDGKTFLSFFLCIKNTRVPSTGYRVSYDFIEDHRDYLYRTIFFRDLQRCGIWRHRRTD